MNAEEVCQKYRVSLSAIKNQFSRTTDKIFRDTGIRIVKEGRGSNVNYKEIFPEHALTFEEEKIDEIAINLEALGLKDWQLLIILCTLIAPMGVFRGNARSFLEYFRMPVTEKRIEEVNEAVADLANNEWISVLHDDSTSEGYFVLYVKRAMEQDIIVKMPYIKICRELMDKYNKRNFLPLLKVWLGTEELQKNQPYTVAQLEEITGLSAYQIRENNKILEKENIYITEKQYVEPTICLGRTVELNAYIPTIEDERG